jgi:hypothetical protein
MFSLQTKGLSLEEINALFGDEVVVNFANATEKERRDLAAKVLAEDEHREFNTHRHQHSGDEVAATTKAER